MKKIKKYAAMFRDILHEWKWVFRYISRYKLNIFIFILLSVGGTVMSLGSNVSVKYFIDAVVNHSDGVIFRYGAMVIGLALLNILMSSVSSWVAVKISTKTSNEIRADVYSHMLYADWQDIKKYHSGELINRMEGDVSTVSGAVIGFIPAFVTNSVAFLGSFAIIFYYDKTMALLSLLSAPLLVVLSGFLVRKIRYFNGESRNVNGEILSFTGESMKNLQVVKAFDLTKHYIESFDGLLHKFRDVRLRYQKFSILISLLLSVMGLLVSYSCYGWGVYRLWKGFITYGTMTLFLQISGRLTGSFGALASMASQAVTIATSAGRIMEVTEVGREEDADRDKALKLLASAKKYGVSLVADDIAFRYADGETDVISSGSFRADPGETIALVGPSGEGKSTVLRLILGIVRPESGALYLKDKNGNALPLSDSTRRFCSYVPQEFGIFTGTIAENLHMGKSEATEEEMCEALRKAEIYDFVSSLPDGLDSEISENAENISKGQAQRIVIARSLLRNSPVMLLDEATSALDADTEKRVLENIMNGSPNRVCIVTTHRESVLKYCDRVYRVDADGKITQA